MPGFLLARSLAIAGMSFEHAWVCRLFVLHDPEGNFKVLCGLPQKSCIALQRMRM